MPRLQLERLWQGIAAHRAGTSSWDEALPPDLVPAGRRLSDLIDDGIRSLPDRLADIEAYAKETLVAEARDGPPLETHWPGELRDVG